MFQGVILSSLIGVMAFMVFGPILLARHEKKVLKKMEREKEHRCLFPCVDPEKGWTWRCSDCGVVWTCINRGWREPSKIIAAWAKLAGV